MYNQSVIHSRTPKDGPLDGVLYDKAFKSVKTLHSNPPLEMICNTFCTLYETIPEAHSYAVQKNRTVLLLSNGYRYFVIKPTMTQKELFYMIENDDEFAIEKDKSPKQQVGTE